MKPRCLSSIVALLGTVTVLPAQTPGTRLWSFPTAGLVASTPAVGLDGSIFFGSEDGHLYALRAEGTRPWAFATGDKVRSSPAIKGVPVKPMNAAFGKAFLIFSAN